MSDEWAKTTGKGIDAARELGGFLAPIVRAPLENAMGIVADKLAYMRWERQQRLMVRAREFMFEQGLEQPTRAVALNVAIPLMQAASMEEDDVLQDTWARLLVNAIDADSGVEARRSLVSLLEEMTSLEVRILAMFFSYTEASGEHRHHTCLLPDELVPQRLYDRQKHNGIPTEKVNVALWNLYRLGCITIPMAVGAVYFITEAGLSPLGCELVRACTLKPKS